MFDRLDDGPTHNCILKGHAEVLTNRRGQSALLDNVFIPLFQHYGNSPHILAWEIMNEPDYVVRGLDWNRKKVKHPISLSDGEYLDFALRRGYAGAWFWSHREDIAQAPMEPGPVAV